ncbi:LysR family transcriptional regulator [Pantoea sp. A4]|uniref:LysR family transcriptional regulator n=1 Tax=Pantoea sp. A4 TaxID=1225184 RepID=UPI000367ADD2|nr:LysR family transcriptional regulator [Pantoea sp. A4]
MTLQQLNYFLTAIESGTISKAAEMLKISQPSISDQILRLENELGTNLFIRTNRRLILTEAGQKLEPHARIAIQAAQNGNQAVQSVRELKDGIASFGTFSSAYQYFLTDLICEFHANYPGVNLKIIGPNSAEVAQAVIDGEIEAGLVMLPVNAKNLSVSEPVWSTELGYVTADSERAKGTKDIHALLNSPLILTEATWRNSDPIRKILNQRAEAVGATLKPVIEIEHQQTAFELASRGVGDMLASKPILHHLGYGERLKWTAITPPVFEKFAFIHRADTAISPATREIIQMMKRYLSRLKASSEDMENL